MDEGRDAEIGGTSHEEEEEERADARRRFTARPVCTGSTRRFGFAPTRWKVGDTSVDEGRAAETGGHPTKKKKKKKKRGAKRL